MLLLDRIAISEICQKLYTALEIKQGEGSPAIYVSKIFKIVVELGFDKRMTENSLRVLEAKYHIILLKIIGNV